MSADSHDSDHAAEAHHHDFDGEPATELGPGEPRTPGWVPALGAAIFVTAGVLWLATKSDGAAPAPAPTAAPQQIVATALPQGPRPSAAPSGAPVRRLDPERLKALQEQIEQRRKAQGAAGAPAPTATP